MSSLQQGISSALHEVYISYIPYPWAQLQMGGGKGGCVKAFNRCSLFRPPCVQLNTQISHLALWAKDDAGKYRVYCFYTIKIK